MLRSLNHTASIATTNFSRPRMYKDRIKRWGLEKNLKGAEAWAIVQTKTQRDIIGKRTVVQKYGQLVDVKRAINHIKRKRRHITNQGTVLSMPHHIVLRTPSPVAAPGTLDTDGDIDTVSSGYNHHQNLADSLLSTYIPHTDKDIEEIVRDIPQARPNDEAELRRAFNEINRIVRSCTRSPSISPPLSTPAFLSVPEELMYSIKTLFAGSFESGSWVVNDNGRCDLPSGKDIEKREAIYNFRDLCMSVVDSYSGSPVEFRRMLSKAFGLVCDVLRVGHPRTIDLLFEIFLYLKRNKLHQVVTMLRGHIKHMSTILFRSELGWGRICQLIGTLDDQFFDQAVTAAWQCTTQAFETHLGLFSTSGLDSRLAFIEEQAAQDLGQAERLLRQLLAQCEQTPDVLLEQIAHIMTTIARNLLDQRRYEEAEILAFKILCSNEGHDARLSPGIQISVMCLLAHSQYHQNKDELTEDNLREAIQLSVEEWGWAFLFVLRCMTWLEGWLREWGREEEADELREKINEAIGLDMTDLEDGLDLIV